MLDLWLYSPLLGLGRSSVVDLFTQSAGLLGRGFIPSQDRYLHKQNKRTQTSMPQVGFEPTIPVFEREALDRKVAVISGY
jgi:hypothetical protein